LKILWSAYASHHKQAGVFPKYSSVKNRNPENAFIWNFLLSFRKNEIQHHRP